MLQMPALISNGYVMPGYFSKLLTLGGDKRLKLYKKQVQKINDLEISFESQSDEELRRLSSDLRERARNGEELDRLLPESFALMREASKRTLGLRHYDVQLIGAMALHDGCIAEMKTGEGKTLVSTAAGFLNALSGNNVHVVTVNDYLAKRDAEMMGKVYSFLGMQVGLLQNQMPDNLRRQAYSADVTYGTNSEFGFDYLRDHMVIDANARVQRGHAFAIVDEVDSILIDEARTPLIISGMASAAADTYSRYAEVVSRLNRENDIILDEAKRTVYASEEGLDKIEQELGFEVYADVSGEQANHLKQALRAEFLFKRDHDYVIADGEVKIVDGFTGRIMEGRRYSEGLHQALEAKEQVQIKPEMQTMATVTLQNYFRMYDKLSGMTGTALTEDSEFEQIYGLSVVPVPTNKPVIRDDKPDFIYRTKDAKFNAVADEIAARHKKGQPVLVGTSSVKDSELLSGLLKKRKIAHEVLNAKEHEREAEIVAQAGRLHAVTVATNMAGRGTDIILGGNYELLKAKEIYSFGGYTEENAPEWVIDTAEKAAASITRMESYAARILGGLYVIGTERYESRRIDNQLRGRSGRQGDPGESRFYLSLEDDLLRLFGQDRIDKVSQMMVSKGIPDDSPLEDELVSKVITSAQKQVESMHFSARKNVLEYDDVMDKQRKAIYSERDDIIDGKNTEELVSEYIRDMVEAEVGRTCPYQLASDDWDFAALDAWIASLTGETGFASAQIVHDEDSDAIAEAVIEHLQGIFDRKRDFVGEPDFGSLCKLLMLRMLDSHWIAHLTEMDQVKAGIGLRSYGHRDPLVEYKEEAYAAFGEMVAAVQEDFLRAILHLPESESAKEIVENDKSVFDETDLVYSDVEEKYVDDPTSDLGNPLK